MGTAYFLIAILGCGEGEAPCKQVATVDTRYESQATCTAATEAAVMRHTDVDFPVVVAQCVAAGSGAAKLKPADISLPEPEETPHFPRRG